MIDLRLEDEKTIRSYILGRLDDAEREMFEGRLIADVSLNAAVDVISGEIADEYAANQLSSDDRRAFATLRETSPQLRQRVQLAAAMGQAASKYEPAPAPAKLIGIFSWFILRPRLSLAFAGLILAVAVGLVLYIPRTLEPREIAANNVAPSTVAASPALAVQPANEVVGVPGNKVGISLESNKKPKTDVSRPRSNLLAAFLLKPGLVRGDGQQRLSILPGTAVVHLQPLLIDNDYPAYSLDLTAADGTIISSVRSAKPRQTADGPVLTFRVPAARLRPSGYTIKVTGLTLNAPAEPVATYSFRVVR